MLNTNNKLMDALHGATSTEKKVAVYTAVSYICVIKLNESSSKHNIMLRMNKCVSRLNELAIIDRPMMTSYMNKMYEYIIESTKPASVYRTVNNMESFLDITRILDYFSMDQIKMIDDNLILFRSTCAATIPWVTDLLEESDES
jgi:hypothetical protein